MRDGDQSLSLELELVVKEHKANKFLRNLSSLDGRFQSDESKKYRPVKDLRSS